MDSDDGSGLRSVALEGHTRVEGQVGPSDWMMHVCMILSQRILLPLPPFTPTSIDRPIHHQLLQQIDCIDVAPSAPSPLIALASSRLEGSTWDGAISLLHATTTEASPTTGSSGITLTRAGAIRPVKYGIPALTWCGSKEKPMLAAARDDGDVEVGVVVWGGCMREGCI